MGPQLLSWATVGEMGFGAQQSRVQTQVMQLTSELPLAGHYCLSP